ncbi:hypothetical protein GX888_00405 [Candidatus Dojkabacteria bacterium]|uniref:Uncharacterized protein n=1 Tax=Candidatus Dojkabacteria bacterium TaxID=2099670 RepID=A0A847VCK9_9BACT|nr:hypothetical protein [Candidatus Dojkabacteria bacterium]
MKLKSLKYILYFCVIVLSSFLLTACTKSNDSLDSSKSEESVSEKPTEEVQVIGNIPDEIVQDIKDSYIGTYTDIVIQEIGMSLPNYYMIDFNEEGYFVKIKPVDVRLEEVIRILDSNKMPYKNVNILLAFTQEMEDPRWERVYSVEVWVKLDGFDDTYHAYVSELAAPEDHPAMSKD